MREVTTRPLFIVSHDNCQHRGPRERSKIKDGDKDEEGDDSDDESESCVELDKYGQKMESGYKEDEHWRDSFIKRSVELTTQLYDAEWHVKVPNIDPVKQIVQRMREVHQWLVEKSDLAESWKLLRGSPYKSIVFNPASVVETLKSESKDEMSEIDRSCNEVCRCQVQRSDQVNWKTNQVWISEAILERYFKEAQLVEHEAWSEVVRDIHDAVLYTNGMDLSSRGNYLCKLK